MKARILLFLFLFPLWGIDINSKQLETEATLREIKLKSTNRFSVRTMRTASLSASVKEIAPTTYLVGSAIAVNFASSTSNASIVVTNSETGEVVHHELFSCYAPTTVLVELDDCEVGVYYIDISTSSTSYSGEFVF